MSAVFDPEIHLRLAKVKRLRIIKCDKTGALIGAKAFKIFSDAGLASVRKEFRAQDLRKYVTETDGYGKQTVNVPQYLQPITTGFSNCEHFRNLLESSTGIPLHHVGTHMNEIWGKPRATREVSWHRNETHLNCVLLLSRMDENSGGRLILRFNGEETEVEHKDFPMNSMILLRGSMIDHRISAFTSNKPRITIVFSFHSRLGRLPDILPIDLERLRLEWLNQYMRDMTTKLYNSSTESRADALKVEQSIIKMLEHVLGDFCSPHEWQWSVGVNRYMIANMLEVAREIHELPVMGGGREEKCKELQHMGTEVENCHLLEASSNWEWLNGTPVVNGWI